MSKEVDPMAGAINQSYEEPKKKTSRPAPKKEETKAAKPKTWKDELAGGDGAPTIWDRVKNMWTKKEEEAPVPEATASAPETKTTPEVFVVPKHSKITVQLLEPNGRLKNEYNITGYVKEGEKIKINVT